MSGCRIVTSCVCDVGGRESVVVISGSGEVYVCAISEEGISVTSTLVLGSKVSGVLLWCYLMTYDIVSVGGEVKGGAEWRESDKSWSVNTAPWGN